MVLIGSDTPKDLILCHTITLCAMSNSTICGCRVQIILLLSCFCGLLYFPVSQDIAN